MLTSGSWLLTSDFRLLTSAASPSWCGLRLELRHGQPVEHFIHEAVFERFLRRHELIAIGVTLDPLQALAGVADENLVQVFLQPQELLRMDEEFRRGSFRARQGLMDHDACVREG